MTSNSVGVVAVTNSIKEATANAKIINRANAAAIFFVFRSPLVMPRVNYLLLSETTHKAAPALP